MFSQQLYREKSKQDTLHTYLHMVPAIFEDFVSIMQNLQYYFPKMRGGDQRPFGTLPKIHLFVAVTRP